jgi:threonine dehydratase
LTHLADESRWGEARIGVARLIRGKVDGRGKRVGVTISGGNIGLDGFCQIINQRDG